MFPEQDWADILVAGGGAAGCVVAGRLAALDRSLNVLLIERGVSNESLESVTTPALFHHHGSHSPDTIKKYKSEPSPYVYKDLELVVGNVLGGGGSVNLMGYSRPSASDLDDWNTEGWSAKDLLPLMRKCENYHPWPDDHSLHGYEGPLNVTYGGIKLEIAQQWICAAESCGYPVCQDMQDLQTGVGSTYWPKWISPDGRRSDSAHAYVHSQRGVVNLRVVTELVVDKIIFEGNKAVGVKCLTQSGKPESATFRAKKQIILCAGSNATPGILERSGIGCRNVLVQAKVDCLVDLPGVGKNYQDHQMTVAVYAADPTLETFDDISRNDAEAMQRFKDLLKNGKGGYATNYFDAGTKYRPSEEEVKSMGPSFQRVWESEFKNKPDKPVSFTSVFAGHMHSVDTLDRNYRYFSTGNWLEHPQSKGYIHIRSKDPLGMPLFDCGFLSDPSDMAVHVWTYKVSREIARRLPSFRGEVPQAHPRFGAKSAARIQTADYRSTAESREGTLPSGPTKILYTKEDDDAIEDWVRKTIGNVYHNQGTAAMKPRDQDGVVDSALNVYGTTQLKVADLSIMPSNVSANTFGIAVVIGEKAACIVAQELDLTMSTSGKLM